MRILAVLLIVSSTSACGDLVGVSKGRVDFRTDAVSYPLDDTAVVVLHNRNSRGIKYDEACGIFERETQGAWEVAGQYIDGICTWPTQKLGAGDQTTIRVPLLEAYGFGVGGTYRLIVRIEDEGFLYSNAFSIRE